jgi:hypothetical protein
MLARTITLQSTQSLLAPTNTDSVFIKKISYKSNILGRGYSSSDENKIEIEKITVKGPKKKKAPFSKSSSKYFEENFNLPKIKNSISLKSNNNMVKILDENKNEIFVKPILKNKNLKKISRSNVNINVTEYEGKKIKFRDENLKDDQPFVKILVVESYKNYNQEISEIRKKVIDKRKIKDESNCKCQIF